MSDDNMDYGQMNEEERQEDLRGNLENGLAELGATLRNLDEEMREVALRAQAAGRQDLFNGLWHLHREIERATEGHPIVGEALMLYDKQEG